MRCHPILPAALLGIAACQHDTTSPLTTGSIDARVASALSVAGFAVATGGEGHSFFDNHLACLRRGVTTYSNDAAGRIVAFHGCLVAPGVVIDGSGHLAWSGSGL